MALAEDIDDISVNWDEGGNVVVEQLDKVILSRGGWATILFKFREQNTRTGVWSKTKFTIRRYQKKQGVFRQQSKFNISSRYSSREMPKSRAMRSSIRCSSA